MNSDYKWRDQTSSRLNEPKTKDYSCENGENVSTANSFIRKHQRNLSLPVNNVFQPTKVMDLQIYLICIQKIINIFIYF